MEREYMRIEDIHHESDEFKDLVRDMPQHLMESCHIKCISPGVEILRKYETMDRVYILCEGEFEVVTSFKGGQVYIVGKAGHKDGLHLIGEQEVLAEVKESQATVRTVTDCRVLEMHPKAFWEWIKNDANAAIILLKHLAKRLNSETQKAGTQLYYPTSHLIKQFIIDQYESSGKQVHRITAKRQQVADELGISIRSVDRSIRILKEQGFIHIVKGKMEVNESEYHALITSIEESEF